MQSHHEVHVFINKKKFDLPNAEQTGASLKNLAGIALGDVLFLQQPHEDRVIANDSRVVLKDGDHLHSQPPADYGSAAVLAYATGLGSARIALHEQSDGWTFLVASGFSVPAGFSPNPVELLIKLPPGFPDAAPDMFWVKPAVKAPGGSEPRSTSTERLLGADWQRFSWHLASGAWKPGASTLADFVRCIRARFLRGD